MRKDTQPKQWWYELLRCPACQKPMNTENQCSAGHQFDPVDGTPRLIPINLSTKVTFAFNSARSFMSQEALLEVFKDPVQPDAAGLP